MTTPRPQPAPRWTWSDHLDNDKRIQRNADQKLWNALGRLIGLRRGELAALLGRFLDDRIAAALRAQPTFLVDQLRDPAQADALRGPLVDLLLEDMTQLITILSAEGNDDVTRADRESKGSGGTNAAVDERNVHDGEAEEDEDAGDARE